MTSQSNNKIHRRKSVAEHHIKTRSAERKTLNVGAAPVACENGSHARMARPAGKPISRTAVSAWRQDAPQAISAPSSTLSSRVSIVANRPDSGGTVPTIVLLYRRPALIFSRA